MPHLDPDRMVDLALFDSRTETPESDHLLVCPSCRSEVSALREVAALGAEAHDLTDLPRPPEKVWTAIVTGVEAPAADLPGHAPATPPRTRSDSHRRIRRAWLPPFLLAAASVVVAVAGTVAVMRLVDRPPTAPLTARATLSPLATAPPDAAGQVEIRGGDEFRIDVSNLPLTNGYYEIWLLDPDAPEKMQSLGSLPRGSRVRLPIPPGTDLHTYRLVDVSAEAHDGDASHSGDSLLRGTLTR